MKRFTLLCLALLFPLVTDARGEDVLPVQGVPDSAEVIRVELGAKRLSNQTHVFTTVPEPLRDLMAVIPHRGPSTSEPGPGYTVTLTRPTGVYLAVHHRGEPTVPEPWKPTGLTVGWGGHEDDVYVQIAEPGPVEVPAHDGRAGGFGVPHMLMVSDDLDRARELMQNPVPRQSAIRRPGRVVVALPDPQQPGLYGHPSDTVRWTLRVVPGTGGSLPTSIEVSLQEVDGDFVWSREAKLGERGQTPVLEVQPPRVGFYEMAVDAGEGHDLVPLRGGIGIVPEPAPVKAESPWGVMRVGRAPFEAKLARMLGVDWVRHSNWNMAHPTPDGGVDPGQFKQIADEYHDAGLHVMASISLVPPALSSRLGETSQSGDAGPLESRVAPADWDRWQAFMHDLAAALPAINHWEIGNEPNTPHHYWAGTVEEFAELFKRSAQGIKAANPDATVLTAGFTLNPDAGTFFDRMLELGVGPYFDVLTVHSLYAKALSVDDMRAILKKHGLDTSMPVWSTEPKQVLPLRNFEAGVRKNMHFMLVNPGAYGAFEALAERDGAATRWGVAYAIASDMIDDARYVETVATGLPDVELGMFDDDGRKLLAARADEGPRGSAIRVRLTSPGSPGAPGNSGALGSPGNSAGKPPIYTDLLGHRKDVPADGEFRMPLDRSGVLAAAGDIEIVGIEIDQDATADPGVEVVADRAELANGFVMRSEEDRPHYAVVFKSPAEVEQAGGGRPSVTFPFELDEPGTYEFFVSAMWYPSHAGNLVSPFSWSIDGKRPQAAPAQTSQHWRRSTRSHLRFGELAQTPTPDAGPTSSQVLAKLGTVRNLDSGQHTLTLELLAPRTHDQHYSMEVELIAARKITDDLE